jgi:hypothetical protein
MLGRRQNVTVIVHLKVLYEEFNDGAEENHKISEVFWPSGHDLNSQPRCVTDAVKHIYHLLNFTAVVAPNIVVQ